VVESTPCALSFAASAGVDDITAVVIILLEGNPKDKTWAAAQKLMNNVDKFMERLRGYKAVIDQGQARAGLPALLGRAYAAPAGGRKSLCYVCMNDTAA
jgi:hypothetical protein